MTVPSMIIGWREYISLPDLGVDKISAKIDSGARTSCLHAVDIEEFKKSDGIYVRFNTLSDDGSIECEAKVKEKRMVKSSNGVENTRYVIISHIQVGAYKWPVEVTLSNRKNMTYKMLFGRTSMGVDFLINPKESFLQGEPQGTLILRKKLYKAGVEHV